MEGDSIYFDRRAGEERERAMRATHPKAQLAHRELAERYQAMAQALANWEMTAGVGPGDSIGMA